MQDKTCAPLRYVHAEEYALAKAVLSMEMPHAFCQDTEMPKSVC